MSDNEEEKKPVLPFHEMGLDDRILKAVAKLGWVQPTLIQVICWPHFFPLQRRQNLRDSPNPKKPRLPVLF
jgi:superfamily II DNA/RNA helicase